MMDCQIIHSLITRHRRKRHVRRSRWRSDGAPRCVKWCSRAIVVYRLTFFWNRPIWGGGRKATDSRLSCWEFVRRKSLCRRWTKVKCPSRSRPAAVCPALRSNWSALRSDCNTTLDWNGTTTFCGSSISESLARAAVNFDYPGRPARNCKSIQVNKL